MNEDRKYSVTASVMANSGRVAAATCIPLGLRQERAYQHVLHDGEQDECAQPARYRVYRNSQCLWSSLWSRYPSHTGSAARR